MRLNLITFFVLISFCCSSQVNNRRIKTEFNGNPEKILIVYLSRTNNTKAIAEMENVKLNNGVGNTIYK